MPLRRFVAFPAILSLASLVACAESTQTRTPTSVDPASGSGQEGIAGALLSEPIVVRVSGSGDQPLGGVKVDWAIISGGGSISPSSSTTNPQGLAQAQWTLGQAVGPQTARGSVPSLTPATFTATAQSPFPPATCGSTPLSLAVGQPHVLSGADATEVCLSGGAGGAQYAAIAFHTNTTFNTSGQPNPALNLQVLASNLGMVASLGDPGGPLSAARYSGGSTSAGWSLEPRPDRDFHSRLRHRERTEFSPTVHPRLAPARGQRSRTEGARLAITGTNPQVGDMVTINAQARFGCTNPINRPGRVAAVSQHAVVINDTENPPNGFTDSDYVSIALTFDTLIHPMAIANFGAPSDMDGNGRAVIFYTREVNKLSEAGSNSFVGGFFYVRDLFPKTGAGSCATSNEGELFYMLVPDPTGIHGNSWSKETVMLVTLGTIAHEYQHLINSSRRLFVNNASVWEDVWLDEGLAHMAEELTFYRSSGLAPRSNLGSSVLSNEHLTAVNRFMVSNVRRLEEYLKAPHASSPYSDSDGLATRGATWNFLRYAADRRGGDETQLWLALVNSTTAGFVNLQNGLGTAPLPWFRDWATSTMVDDFVGGVPAQYTAPSWNMREIFADQRLGGVYPLFVHTLGFGQMYGRNLVPGATAYTRLSVGVGGTAALQFRNGGLTPPPTLSVTLVRTQ